MKRLISFAVAIAALSISAQAGPGMTISVGPNIAVTTDQNTPRNEVWLAIDPTNAKHLLGAVTTLRDSVDGLGLYDTTHYSLDGGNTWSESDPVAGESADPQSAYGPNGSAYLVTLRRKPDATLFFRSSDGGRTWSRPVALLPTDHERITADLGNGPHRGRIYIAGEGAAPKPWPFVRRAASWLFTSDDNGKTCSHRIIATKNIAKGERYRGGGDQVGIIQVFRNGTVAIGIIRYTVGSENPIPRRFDVIVSHDGGRTFSHDIQIAKTTQVIGLRQGAYGSREVGHFSLPSMAVDTTSGSYHDRLYGVWSDTIRGRNRMLLGYSTDYGKTWSKPKDFDPTFFYGDDYLANLAVNNRGVVGVLFVHSTTIDPPNRSDAYFVASADGGVSFTSPVRVSSQSSLPEQPGNWRPIPTGQSADAKSIAATFMDFIIPGEDGHQGVAGHGRHLSDVLDIIERSQLSARVRERASAGYRRLG